MKIKWGWILVAVVLMLFAAALGLRLWFNAPGVRVLGDDIHVDVSQKCYIIDGQTGELLDETTVTVKGATSRSDQKLIDGEL